MKTDNRNNADFSMIKFTNNLIDQVSLGLSRKIAQEQFRKELDRQNKNYFIKYFNKN